MKTDPITVPGRVIVKLEPEPVHMIGLQVSIDIPSHVFLKTIRDLLDLHFGVGTWAIYNEDGRQVSE